MPKANALWGWGLLPPWGAAYPLLSTGPVQSPWVHPSSPPGLPRPRHPLGSDSLMADLNIPFVLKASFTLRLSWDILPRFL